MVKITVNVNDEILNKFIEVVKMKFGEKEGMFEKSIEMAMKRWIDDQNQTEIAERQIALMRKGVGTLNGRKFNREEIYEHLN